MKYYLLTFLINLTAWNVYAETNAKLEQLCTADEAPACESLRQRCLKNSKEACFRFGMIGFKAGEYENSAVSFQRSCKLGSSEGCEAYTKAKQVLAIDQNQRQEAQSKAERDATARERALDAQRTQQKIDALQGLNNFWNRPNPEPKQTNCRSVPHYFEGRVTSMDTVCE